MHFIRPLPEKPAYANEAAGKAHPAGDSRVTVCPEASGAKG